jgi:PhzF family phenazine biosynthesis protein
MSAGYRYRYLQVDVFTKTPFAGNPVAVVFGADALDTATMQQIAQWTNLSETVFVVAPTVAGADYRARIFAQDEELPFAGHPTLGTAHAVLDAGIATATNGMLRMECGAGVVDVTVHGPGDMSFRQPRYAARPVVGAEQLTTVLGVPRIVGDAEMIDTGPHWLIVHVDDVGALTLDVAGLRSLLTANRATGITLYAQALPEEIAVRTFFFAGQLAEDPICGSGNAAVAVHRMRAGAISDGDTYHARQGQYIGRDGEVGVRIDGADVHVGGHCITCIRGELLVPG